MSRAASDEVIPGRAAISVNDPGTDVPEGWTRVRLTDVARLESGHTPSRKHPEWWGGDVPWVSLPDAREHHGRVINDTKQKTNELGLANSAARWLPKDTVCLSRTASVGYVFRLGRPMATSQDFVNWICSDAVDPRFLMQALLAEGKHLLNFGMGTTHTTIYFPAVLAFHINLAPVAEQRRIVTQVHALLEQVNRAKARLDRVPTILKRFRQAVLAAACSGELTREWRSTNGPGVASRDMRALLEGRRQLWEKRNGSAARARKYPVPFDPAAPDEFDVPENWTWVTVSHLALLDVGFAFKSAEFSERGVRLLRGENVEPGALRWSETRYWPKDKLDDVRHLLVEPGEIILALDRPIVSAGLKLARVRPSDTPALLVQRVMRFKMVEPADSDYLHLCLSQQRFIDFLAHEGMTGSDLPHITGTGVAEFPIALPSSEEQREIVRRANGLLALADAIERRVQSANARAERLPQAILARAFSGELVQPEADLARAEGRTYETAEELLNRVRRERDNAEATAAKGSRGRGRESNRLRPRTKRSGV